MHRLAMFSVEDRRVCVEDARIETSTGADFFRLEHPRGRSLGNVELELKKTKTNGTASKTVSHQKPCQKMTEPVVMDGGKARRIGQGLRRSLLPRSSFQH